MYKRQAEKHLAETAVLKRHIVNYARTREVYAAYRKSGYSAKYRLEHADEIALHRAAKPAFDALGVQKLPSVKVCSLMAWQVHTPAFVNR